MQNVGCRMPDGLSDPASAFGIRHPASYIPYMVAVPDPGTATAGVSIGPNDSFVGARF